MIRSPHFVYFWLRRVHSDDCGFQRGLSQGEGLSLDRLEALVLKPNRRQF